MLKYLVLINSNEVVRVSPDRIAYISSDGNYSTMMLIDNEQHLFSFNLSAFEKVIEQQLESDAQTFIRLGKSLIVNARYIYYINISKQQLILSDIGFAEKFTLSASKEALKALRNMLEKQLKNGRIE